MNIPYDFQSCYFANTKIDNLFGNSQLFGGIFFTFSGRGGSVSALGGGFPTCRTIFATNPSASARGPAAEKAQKNGSGCFRIFTVRVGTSALRGHLRRKPPPFRARMAPQTITGRYKYRSGAGLRPSRKKEPPDGVPVRRACIGNPRLPTRSPTPLQPRQEPAAARKSPHRRQPRG